MTRRARAALMLVLGVNGLAGVGPVTALAARTVASPFELTFELDDSVPPSIAVSRARLSRLQRSRGAYSLRLGLVIRDDVQRNPVGYTVVVNSGALALARKVGTTASGRVSLALRLRPLGGTVRSIRLVVTAIDPAGNKASLSRTMRLPR